MTFRLVDGREIAYDELPTKRAVNHGETVRAETIVVHFQDGQTVTTLVNATPIRSVDDEAV